MNNKILFVTVLTVSLFISSGQVMAQAIGENGSGEQIHTKVIQVADVEIINPKILTQRDNKINLSWELVNGENIQPDVNYGVKLIKYVGEDKLLVDEFHYDHVLNLVGKETIKLEVEYTAPAFLQGEYEVWIQAFNSNSLTFALVKAGKINLSGNNKYIEIETQSCYLTITDSQDQTSYSPLQGVTINSQENILAHCPIKNNFGQDMTVTGKITLHYRSLTGSEVASNSQDNVIEMKSGERKDYQILLPKPTDNKPQAYEALLKFYNEQNEAVSSPVIFHFVLTGPSATIQNLTLDKDSYQSGEIAKIDLYWTGAADDYLNSRLKEGNKSDGIQMTLGIKNGDGQDCAEIVRDTWVASADKKKIINLPITINCLKPKVSISLTDSSSGQILDQKKYDIITRQGQNNNKLIILLVIMIVLVGLVLVLWSKKTTKHLHLWLGLFLGIGIMLFTDKASAKTFIMEATWGATTIGRIEYTVSLDRATYVQDDPMSYSVSVKDANCLNHSAKSDFQVWIDDAFLTDGDHGQTDPQNQLQSLTLGDTTIENPPSNFDDSFSSLNFIASHDPNDLGNPYHFMQSQLNVSIKYAPDPANLHNFGPFYSFSSGFDIPFVIKDTPTPPGPAQTLTDPVTSTNKDVTVNNPSPSFDLKNFNLRYEMRCNAGNPIVDLYWEKYDKATQYYVTRNNNPFEKLWTSRSYDLGDGGFHEGSQMEIRSDYINYTQGLTYQDQLNPCLATCFNNANCINDSDWNGIVDSGPYYSIRDIDDDTIPDIHDLQNGYSATADPDNDLDNDAQTNDVDTDIDNDGVDNDTDTDDDNDGILDSYDVDWDNDQIINLLDTDSGGGQSDLDNDLDDDGLTNDVDPDIDNDSILNQGDDDWDNDGIKNNIDVDDDGDGIADADEIDSDNDFDNDGLINDQDQDNDGDGILNNTDNDNDNDGWVNDLDPNSQGGVNSDCSSEYRVYAHVPINNYKMTVASETPTTIEYNLDLVYWPESEQFLSHYRYPSYAVGSANTVVVPMYCSAPGQPPVTEDINLTTSVDCSDYTNPKINLDWSTISNIESTYIIKFDVDNYPPRNILSVNPASDVSLDDASVLNNTTYGYYVQILKNNGEYLYSKEKNVLVQCTPPLPNNLTVSGGCSECDQGNASINVNWDWGTQDLTLPVRVDWSLENTIGSMSDWESDQTYITHPNYPNLYPENYDNTWIITKPGMSRMRIHFASLQLDWSDYLVVSDVDDNVIAEFENVWRGPFYLEDIPGDTVKIHFYSDPWSGSTRHWLIDSIDSIDEPQWTHLGSETTGSLNWTPERGWLDGKTIYFRAKTCDMNNNCSNNYATTSQTFTCTKPDSLAVVPDPINVKNAGRSIPLMALVRCNNGDFMTDELGRQIDVTDNTNVSDWVLDSGILTQRPDLVVEDYAFNKSIVDNHFYGTFSETVDLSSPNYPANYNDNDIAVITITKPGATFIRVNFDDFVVHYSDEVTIVETNDFATTQTSTGFSKVVRGDTIKIKFVTNQAYNEKGWHINEIQWSEGEENSIPDANGTIQVSYAGDSSRGIPPLTGTGEVNVVGQAFVLHGTTDCSEYDLNQNPTTIFNLNWDSYPGADGYVVVDKTDTSDQKFYYIGNNTTYSERQLNAYNRTYQVWAIDINNADWLPIAATNNVIVGLEPCSTFGDIEYSLNCANPSDPEVTLNFSTMNGTNANYFYLLKNGFDRIFRFSYPSSSVTYTDPDVETSYSKDNWQTQAENTTSPNYPANYTNNYSNTWTFTHPGALKMRLHFSDFIGPYRGWSATDNDRVEILDNANTIVQTIREGEYNDHIGPMTTVTVTGDTIKVRFISDNNGRQARGWKINQLEYAESNAASNVYTYKIVPYFIYSPGINDAAWEKKLPETNTLSVTVDCDDKPDAPTNLSIDTTCPACGIRDAEATLNWDDATGAQNYDVEYSSRFYETDLTDIASPGYPANITGQMKRYYTITKPGAVAMQVHFSEIQLVWMERIYISNERDEVKEVINGEDFPTGKDSIVVQGDTIKIFYNANGWAGEDRKFKIDSVNWFNYTSGTRYWLPLGTVNSSQMTFKQDLLDVNNHQVYYRVYSLKNGLRSDDYGEYNYTFDCSVPENLKVVPGSLTLDANGDTVTFNVNAGCSAGENLPPIDIYNNYLTKQLSTSLTSCSPGTNVTGFNLTSGTNTSDCSGTLGAQVENYFFDHYSWGPLSGSGDVEILGSGGPTPPDEPTRFFEPNGQSQLTDNLSNSQITSDARHTLKYKINNTNIITDGSIKINFAQEFDLSGLTTADVSVTGGDVVWGTPSFGSVIIPFTGDLNNLDGEITITIGVTNFINNPNLVGSYPITLTSHNSTDGTGDPVDQANDEAQIFDDSLNDVLSDSIKTEDSKHTIHFNPGSIVPITNGSIKIILADEFDLTGLTAAVVLPSGGDVTWGVAAVNVAQKRIVIPYTGVFDNTDGLITIVLGNNDDQYINNPIDIGSYAVTLSTHTTSDGSGSFIEQHQAMVAITDAVTVTAMIPSTLTFEILPMASGIAVNGSTTNMSTEVDLINFDLLTPAVPKIASHQLRVSTNAASGFAVTLQALSNFNSNTSQINFFNATNDNPSVWHSPSGGANGYFGYTTTDTSLASGILDRFSGNKWAGLTTSPAEVMYHNGPTSGTVEGQGISHVGYQLEINELQTAGNYQTSLIYICTPTY